jgi:hypothetical protein
MDRTTPRKELLAEVMAWPGQGITNHPLTRGFAHFAHRSGGELGDLRLYGSGPDRLGIYLGDGEWLLMNGTKSSSAFWIRDESTVARLPEHFTGEQGWPVGWAKQRSVGIKPCELPWCATEGRCIPFGRWTKEFGPRMR